MCSFTQASSESDSSDIGTDLEGEDREAVDAYWELREAEEDMPVIEPPAVEANMPKVTFLAANVVVFTHPVNARRVGRQSMLQMGTPAESVSVYCNLHGCSVHKRSHSMPCTHDLKLWFRDGLALPAGADGRADHMRTFPFPDR